MPSSATSSSIIMPGITHWQSPNFFGYFPSNNSPPLDPRRVAFGRMGVQGMLWATSPACTELETHVLDWLVDMLGLPAAFKSDSTGGGVIQDSASSATLCAILAARERATGGQSNLRGAGRLADRLHLLASPFVGGEGRARSPGWAATTSARSTSTSASPCAPSGWPRPSPPTAPPGDARVSCAPRWAPPPRRPSIRCGRSAASAAGEGMAARGCGLGRHGRLVPRVPPTPERPGVGRQLLFQSAQVDVHQLRLRLFFRGRSGRPDPHAEHPARVSPQPGDAIGGGDRLSRLASAVGAAVPRAEALVRDPLLRGRRACRSGSACTWPWPGNLPGGSKRTRDSSWRPPCRWGWCVSGIAAAMPSTSGFSTASTPPGGCFLSHTRLDGKLTLRLSIGQTNTQRRHVEQAWQLIREAADAEENGGTADARR